MNSPQQNQKIELTKHQQDPYLARPEDFDIAEPNEIASRAQPFHGQCGDSTREYNKLLAIRASKPGKSKVTDKSCRPQPTMPVGRADFKSRALPKTDPSRR